MNHLNLKDHLLQWIKIVKKTNENNDFRVALINLIKNDIVYFINTFIYTYDPRNDEKIVPFQLYPFQEQFILKLEVNYKKKESILVEKSRDMGFSWCVLAWMTHHFLFDEGFSAGIASRKQSLVDELGVMDSLMEKIRFMIRRLPPFISNGWDETVNSKLMAISHSKIKSSITGESGDEIGRGGRKSVYLLDEFAFVPRSAVVHAAVSQTSNMKIFGSTPNGKGNEFARLRWKTDIDRVTLHWRDHPNKNDAWYAKQKETLDEAILAQEIDISYEKSTVGRVYRVFSQDRHAKDKVIYNPNYPVFATFDWGIGDPTSCILLQDYQGVVRIFDGFERKDLAIEQIFNEVALYLNKYQLQFYDVNGWYGDPDGRNRNIVTGNSIKDFIKTRYNILLRYKLPNVIKNRVMSVRSLLNQNRLIIDRDLSFIIECFENYKYPSNENSENEKPLHNWASHTMSAIEYYCDYVHGMDQFKVERPAQTLGWR